MRIIADPTEDGSTRIQLWEDAGESNLENKENQRDGTNSNG